MLIAVNGTLRMDNRSAILANGGNGGRSGRGSCASAGGGGGSGGAIRLLAGHFAGDGQLLARGGTVGGGPGVIRLEPLDGQPDPFTTDPVAQRPGSGGPLGNPLASTVAISVVHGQPIPDDLRGPTGGTDIVVFAPGPVPVQISTTGVPAGTTHELSAKPRVGGGPILMNAVIEAASCDAAGACTTVVEADRPSGLYIAEAKATFRVP